MGEKVTTGMNPQCRDSSVRLDPGAREVGDR